VVTQLKLQVKEVRNNLSVQQTANRDLADKMREVQETLSQQMREQMVVKRSAETKQDRGDLIHSELKSHQSKLVVLNADLKDKQLEYQAVK
jgi:hypothetical protein